MKYTMKREILFRGLRTDGGGWAYGYYRMWFNSSTGKNVHIISNDYAESFEVISASVGQYTGLKDKNGTKIFEWDKLKPDTYNEEVLNIVRWDDDSYKFVIDIYKFNYYIGEGSQEVYDNEVQIMDSIDLCDYIQEYFEVIGNIHEN